MIAAGIYGAFAAYLFFPYFGNFRISEYLIPLNCFIAAVGAYILSKRWVAGLGGRFFAGAIYGFGPFMFFLAKFHPTAGSIAAVVVWLFIPAVFFFGANKWIRVPLAVGPFVVLVFIFMLADRLGLYPVPIQIRLEAEDLVSIIAPAAMVNRADILLGVYHILLAGLLIGAVMLVAARRYAVMVIFAGGILLSIFDSYSPVPSIIWLSVPLVCCAVLVGQGFEGIIHCGYSDRKWVLASGILLLVCAVVTLLFGTKAAYVFAGMGLKYTRLFTEAAKMYLVGAVAVAVVYFLARGKSRLLLLREGIFAAAVAVDIFFSARVIVDSIF